MFNATTDAAGYSVNDTVITLSATGTGNISAGKKVKFAGDPNEYTLTAGDTDVSDGGTLTLEAPGLLQSIPASATAITQVGWIDGVRYGAGCYGNTADVFPVASSTFEDINAKARNTCSRPAGPNPWKGIFGIPQFNDGWWVNDIEWVGELQVSQVADASYAINLGGTGATSELEFSNGGSGASYTFSGVSEVTISDTIQTPNPNASQLNVNGSANSGISIMSGAAGLGTVRMGRSGQDSAGIYGYDHNVDSCKIWSNDTLALEIDSSQDILPGSDNTQQLGNGSLRYSEVFAGNGTINTSDETLKTEFTSFSDSEKAAAAAIKNIIGKFQWLDSVEAKGQDSARIHIGVPAQEVGRILEANGLDPHRYSFYCYDEWDETQVLVQEESIQVITEETIETYTELYEGERVERRRIVPAVTEVVPAVYETRPAGNRYGIRYDQLLMFIIANT